MFYPPPLESEFCARFSIRKSLNCGKRSCSHYTIIPNTIVQYNSQTNVHYENYIYSYRIIQAGNVCGRVFVCSYYYYEFDFIATTERVSITHYLSGPLPPKNWQGVIKWQHANYAHRAKQPRENAGLPCGCISKSADSVEIPVSRSVVIHLGRCDVWCGGRR